MVLGRFAHTHAVSLMSGSEIRFLLRELGFNCVSRFGFEGTLKDLSKVSQNTERGHWKQEDQQISKTSRA